MNLRPPAGLLLVAGLCLALGGAQRVPRVGIQAGHWQDGGLPDELWRLRADTGATWGSIREADVDLALARLVVAGLEADGVQADLLPAVIPESYAADAFVAIHAEGAAPPGRSGWKVAGPWIASDACRLLRDDVARWYGTVTGLPEDRYGITANMRGYYAFAWARFFHAIAPATPAVIIETGFLGAEADRKLIAERPEIPAAAIVLGILGFLDDEKSLAPEQFTPAELLHETVKAPGTAVRFYPDPGERVVGRLAGGAEVYELTRREGWTEVLSRRNHDIFGWVPSGVLAPR